MDWLGLNYDEGPFYQTQRGDRYKFFIQKLLDEGKAYRCYCSPERLDNLRKEQLANKEKPRYDGLCRSREGSLNEPHVIRFKNPLDGSVSFQDQIHGTIKFENKELDDFIISRSDSSPTYNFCVVIDDLDMKISHVIRGDDHINNTPKQINLINALGEKAPLYAHLPMILGPDGTKLSKRHGATSVLEYKKEGFLPQALINYLVRLGWSCGDKEIFSLDEMIEFFDIKDVNKAQAAINFEKLLWLNQHYIKTSKPCEIEKELSFQFSELKIDTNSPPLLSDIISVQSERSSTLKEMAEKSRYFYEDVKKYDEKAIKKHINTQIIPIVAEIKKDLESLSTWCATEIHKIIINISEKFSLKLGKIAQPLRIAVTGGTISPPIDVTLELIGKKRVTERLDSFLSYISDQITN